MMADMDMWKVCIQAANMLDGAGSDWRRLLAIEDRLWPLATALDQAAAATKTGSPDLRHSARVDPDLRLLQSSLSWIRRHEYDALESDLKSRLDVALVSAMNTLAHRDQSNPPHAHASAPPSIARAAHAVAGQ
jgi:hypothetical protein